MIGEETTAILFGENSSETPFIPLQGSHLEDRDVTETCRQLAALAAKVDASIEPDGESYEDD